jgi:hypothetical protein
MLLSCVSLSTLAQENIIFKGRVIDDVTNLPVQFVHIGINHRTPIGTITNENGEFIFKIPDKFSGKNLTFSCIGYDRKEIKIISDNFKTIIRLIPSRMMLDEITITPKSPQEIIKSAYSSIPNNYYDKPSMATGFFRQSIKTNKFGLLYISEAVLEARKETYEKQHKIGQVKNIQSRKKLYYDEDTLRRIKFYGAPHLFHRYDYVIRRAPFINPNNFDQYDYELKGTTSYNGNLVYLIAFKMASKASGSVVKKGRIYIDVETYALIGFHYSSAETGSGIKFKSTKNEIKVNYMPMGNRWYLQNIWSQVEGYDKILKDSIIGVAEFVVTNVDTVNTSLIPYNERLQFRDLFINEIDSSKSNFWKNHNILETDENVKNALVDKELNEKALSTSFGDTQSEVYRARQGKRKKILKIISNIQTSLAVNVSPAVDIPLNTTINYRGTTFDLASKKQFYIGIANNITYKANDLFYLTQHYSESIGKSDKVKNFQLGGAYKINLSTKNRPFFLRGGTGLAYSVLKNNIGTLNSAGSITISKRKLQLPVTVFARNQVYSIQSVISPAMELNHQMELFVDMHYSIPFHEKDNLFFKERKGFLRKKTAEDFNSREVIILQQGLPISSSPLNISNFSFNIGLRLKLSR